jgi:hypothetical protein
VVANCIPTAIEGGPGGDDRGKKRDDHVCDAIKVRDLEFLKTDA